MKKSFLIFVFLAASQFLFADGAIVRNVTQGIELRNERVAITLSSNGELLSCTDVTTNTDIAAHDHKKIAKATLKGGGTEEATKVELNGNTLSLWLGREKVEMEIVAFNDYFTVEVKKTPSNFEKLTFLDLSMKYDFNGQDPFVASGVAMTLQTNPVYYPTGESKKVTGVCTAHTGLTGAKLAIVVCHKNDLRDILKKLYRTIPKKDILVNYKGGGPFALDCEANSYDCVLLKNTDSSYVPDWIRFYTNLGVKQIDFLMGPTTFVQGQFSFPGTETATDFKEKITAPLDAAGIISTLHTYVYYISYKSEEILSNPKWQQQLELMEEFSLSDMIDAVATEIDVREDIFSLTNDDSFWKVHTPYFLIDNEIIRYTIGENGFVSCKRGQCGTKATSHKARAKIRIIGGHFSHIAPQIGSELYYEIAHRTAKAYNEGGFKGFYFDALDGLHSHLKHAGLEDYFWYYSAAFVKEVLNNCETEPLVVEYSDMNCTLWPARGRAMAWDVPYRGYKNFIDDHVSNNKTWKNRQYVTTLGWYNFYPTKEGQPRNFSTKYMFSDEIDYIGAKSIAYGQTMVYNGLLEKDVESVPALQRNLENYSRYNKLRLNEYFTDEVKSILQKDEYEYRLRQKGGKWGFDEATYCRDKIRDITRDRLKGTNPFKKQKPFIRLENMYSSDCSSFIPLMQFNDGLALSAQKGDKTFDTPLNLLNHLGLRVTVKGNGIDSSDAICIRLRTSETSGYADYIVRLNFEGWRDVIVPNLDNAEYRELKFQGMEDKLYYTHRNDVDFTKVRKIQLYLSGECKGARLQRIDAVPLMENALTTPQIRIGQATVTFMDVLQSGEYIEYMVGKKTAFIFDSRGNFRKVKIKREGSFLVPKGAFEAIVTGKSELNNAPTEVVLTFGLYGIFVKN